MNYICWSVRCSHYQQDGTSIDLTNTRPVQGRLTWEGRRWRREVVAGQDRAAQM
jgi:hypothetical protein